MIDKARDKGTRFAGFQKQVIWDEWRVMFGGVRTHDSTIRKPGSGAVRDVPPYSGNLRQGRPRGRSAKIFRGMREPLIHRSPDRCPDHRRFPILVPIIVLIVVAENEKTKIGTTIGMKIKTKIKNDNNRDEDRDEDNRSLFHVLGNVQSN